MDKKELLHKITEDDRLLNGIATGIFLIVMCVFVFGFIRPQLRDAFGMREEIADLMIKTDKYNSMIARLAQLQDILQTRRNDFYLLQDAIPYTFDAAGFITDLERNFASAHIDPQSIVFGPVVVEATTSAIFPYAKKNTIQTQVVAFDVQAPFSDVSQLLKLLLKDRRLKNIKKVQITKMRATSSAHVRVNIELYGYFTQK